MATITPQEINQFFTNVEEMVTTINQNQERLKLLDKLESKYTLSEVIYCMDHMVNRFLDDNFNERHPDLNLRDLLEENNIHWDSKEFRDSVILTTARWSKRTRTDETKEDYFIREVICTYGHNTKPDADGHYGYNLYKSFRKEYDILTKELIQRDLDLKNMMH